MKTTKDREKNKCIHDFLLSDALWKQRGHLQGIRSKSAIKGDLVKELPECKKAWLNQLTDYLVGFDTLHSERRGHFALEHKIMPNKLKRLMKLAGIKDIHEISRTKKSKESITKG